MTLVDEMLAGLLARPGRTALTVLGTAIGICALVAIVGTTQTAAEQIAERIDAEEATHATISSSDRGDLPWHAADGVARLNGVAAAGTLSPVGRRTATTFVGLDPSRAGEHAVAVAAASPGLFDAVEARVVGRQFDVGHERRADRVCLVGADLATTLRLPPVESQPTVFLDGEAYTAVGTVADPSGTGLAEQVVVPEETARSYLALDRPGSLHIRTRLGALHQVVDEALVVLAPGDTGVLDAQVPRSPDGLRRGVEADTSGLVVALGIVMLLVGGVGTANVTLAAVLERTAEIGLRRAVGATRRAILVQFLGESAIVGALGGLTGASTGVVVLVHVSSVRHWTPVLDLRTPAAGIALGMLVGLVAGAHPAVKAARVEPVAALREG